MVVAVAHNHEPEPEKLKCYKVIDDCKATAILRPNDNPRSIIRSSQTFLDEESSRQIVRPENLVKRIHRTRPD